MDAKHPTHANHGQAIVARAERVCAEKRLHLTPWRRRVLEELADGAPPLGAYDIIERLGRERRVAPISVYRALEFLISAGLVHKIASRNSYVPCHHSHRLSESTVFLVCKLCGSVEERSSAAVAKSLGATARAAKFKLQSRSVELEGECSACQDSSA